MKVKVSVTTKLLSIVVAMMLTVTVAIAVMLIAQSQSNIEQQHKDFQLKNQRQMAWMDELFTVRLLVWVETFSRWGHTETLSEQELLNALKESEDALNVSLQISDMWLFNADGKLITGNREKMPVFIPEMEQHTRDQIRPQNRFDCREMCYRYVTAPIMIEDQQIAVLVLSSSFGELLAALSQFSSAYKIAIVRYEGYSADNIDLKIVSQLSNQNQQIVNTVLAATPSDATTEGMVERGVLVKQDKKRLLVSLLPMSEQHYYILFIRDITAVVESVNAYQNMVIGTAITLFFLFTVLLLLLIHQYKTKLLQLVERLPLLAEHRYQEFSHGSSFRRQWKDKLFPDELDLLEETAHNLAERLEEQDSKIAASNAQLENMAMFDGLTGLPNRTMMTFQIEKHIVNATRDQGLAAVLFLDLDDFKKVNDSHGHDVGDKLIHAASERIANAVGEHDLVGRFGGDEFVILLSKVRDKSEVEAVAKSVINVFSRPIQVDSLPFYVSTSIGVAITNQPETTAMELLRHADIAMYEAKALKGASFKLYDASMNIKVMRKVELEREARVALRENQFSLALQPQISIDTFRLEGFEALIRWYHPVKGYISPGEFIPMLENTPFMLELDYWVLTRSLRILNELNISGYSELKMAINISAAQFSDITLPNFLAQQLALYELAPDKVELELTETALVSDMDSAIDVCKALQDMGCLVAIDDFGTGYSSLSYLKSLPVDYVKIDQSFISGMLDNPEDANIVESTIALVRSLGRTVIAEGVETPEQLGKLGEFYCHQAQGYLISPPIPEAQLWERLEKNVKDGCWQNVDKRNAGSSQHQFEF
ncbi:putative bifunctional diguanylate cyclase/phosphodiesterase [Alteromonas sp. RKMC-009]|uniref:putative bifunctional diguanylate cyclase/phosphodiesterase n=1 Tax=Alteromonas sp. RKMC-009 TaxID=2267264 RepID=UPI000E692910|nr:bifunctional diguanylate cyclase/phosphodiesterase [Alteromonas sp. RKMC-009]AYA62576.1 bifunctional diguanylate cyclase/phosphodiesterase [Alteromonas sp. RKMC-009]